MLLKHMKTWNKNVFVLNIIINNDDFIENMLKLFKFEKCSVLCNKLTHTETMLKLSLFIPLFKQVHNCTHTDVTEYYTEQS